MVLQATESTVLFHLSWVEEDFEAAFSLKSELKYSSHSRSLHTYQMAKTCLHKVAAALVLLLMVATAQSIRLDAGSRAALSNQALNKSVEKGVAIEADGAEASSGEVEETGSISEEKDRAGHRMPDIHVDYYGPRGHNPRHH